MRDGAQRIADSLRTSGPLWTASLIADRALPYGLLGLWPDRRVGREALESQVEAILAGWGMSGDDLAATVSHIVAADLRGVESHGVSMLLGYHRLLLAGSLTVPARVEVVSRDGATAVVDGGGGLGHVPAERAMRLAIELAAENGTGVVAVRNSGHFGAAGVYAEMASEQGLIGLVTTDTLRPAVVPALGAEPMLGTNPIAFAAPGHEGPAFVLDMATTTASLGRVLGAWRRGRRLPAGWALRRDGGPERNGRRAYEARRLTPLGARPALGSYKGYGLAAMVEVLSALLPAGRGEGVGHFMLALDPGRFDPGGGFGAALDALGARLRATPPQDPERPVLVPGDPERGAQAERRRSGIPLSRSTLEDIRAVARRSGVPFTLDTS